MENYEMLKEMYPDPNDQPLGAATMSGDGDQSQPQSQPQHQPRDAEDVANTAGPQESLRQQYLEQQALMRLKRLQQKGHQQDDMAQSPAVDVSSIDYRQAVVLEQNRKVAAFDERIEKEVAASGHGGGRTPYNPDAYDNGNDEGEDDEVQGVGVEDEQRYYQADQDSERWNQHEGVTPTSDFDYSSVGNNRGSAGLGSSGNRILDQSEDVMSNEKVSFYANTLRSSHGGADAMRMSQDDMVAEDSGSVDVTRGSRGSLESRVEAEDVVVGEDPGQLIVYEDGKRERRFKSGRRQLWFRNGTEKEIGNDGSATVRFANGDIKKTHSDTGLVVYFYASANTTHTTYGNGVEIFEFPNGQVRLCVVVVVILMFFWCSLILRLTFFPLLLPTS